MNRRRNWKPRLNYGPEIQVTILVDGKAVCRNVVIEFLYLNDIVLVKGVDEGVNPVQFFVKGGLNWDLFYRKLVDCWARGVFVCRPFRLRATLPAKVMDNLMILPPKERAIVIETLRNKGFLAGLVQLRDGTQPQGMEWFEVASLCYRLA